MKTFLNWAAIAILLALIVWGYTLNQAHQKRWTDTDVQKSLNDTIDIDWTRDTMTSGGITFVEVFRTEAILKNDTMYRFSTGKVYRRLKRDSAERRATP